MAWLGSARLGLDSDNCCFPQLSRSAQPLPRLPAPIPRASSPCAPAPARRHLPHAGSCPAWRPWGAPPSSAPTRQAPSPPTRWAGKMVRVGGAVGKGGAKEERGTARCWQHAQQLRVDGDHGRHGHPRRCPGASPPGTATRFTPTGTHRHAALRPLHRAVRGPVVRIAQSTNGAQGAGVLLRSFSFLPQSCSPLNPSQSQQLSLLTRRP